ncbi:MAG: N-acetyl-gamma-glutamyl-phosphate reductase [Actinomycetota bacterium]|nr:N-acetyl-gamma-glutamyl-phosphate reductase [Actinomycetota bacterium]
MGISAAVVGASGYAGGEVLRLLNGHSTLDVGAVVAHSNAGRPLGELHPQLVELAGLELQALEPGVLDGADVVFLALPHGKSGAVAADLPEGTVVIDLGADHRLAEAAQWSRFYSGEHAGTWTYGLPELPGARRQLAGAKRVAAPGCYPSAVGLALAPLFAAGLVEPADVVVMAASGTSGAGRSPSLNLLGSEVMGSLSAYKAGGVHQHTPEMVQTLSAAAGTAVSLSFTPVLAPMPRGILATCTARLTAGADVEALRQALTAAYADEPFVHVLPEGRWPSTASVSGSNSAHLQVAVDAAVGRAVVIAAIDNLGKGAAGQAIQCANIALGLPETAGLSINGVAP